MGCRADDDDDDHDREAVSSRLSTVARISPTSSAAAASGSPSCVSISQNVTSSTRRARRRHSGGNQPPPSTQPARKCGSMAGRPLRSYRRKRPMSASGKPETRTPSRQPPPGPSDPPAVGGCGCGRRSRRDPREVSSAARPGAVACNHPPPPRGRGCRPLTSTVASFRQFGPGGLAETCRPLPHRRTARPPCGRR